MFWTAAQYRNVYTRFDRQLILYTTLDDDFNHVQMQLDSLSVSFGFLQRPSEVSEYWLRIPRARNEIDALGEFMARLKREVPLLRDSPKARSRSSTRSMRTGRRSTASRTTSARSKWRSATTFHQLKEKQRAILILGIVLGVILCALFLLLF